MIVWSELSSLSALEAGMAGTSRRRRPAAMRPSSAFRLRAWPRSRGASLPSLRRDLAGGALEPRD